ncbi:GDP-mannose dehydrogenase (plasmid) [Azospirillum argentinense]|uniref:GDP-mannose dehydrogenase n=1 Tax=Azospirillum argentinense TaxID=2970906 RepID=A0A060DSA1_9PROT|nr:nucleotide sugar dehydrogenase [Azospirillum argentinense]AIB16721.1 GDP-mannose dehydrogenase [Azospirillum argentinense]EZQ02320.1 GDP-mannose dehydrogenase [Azospirillum argentinense]
MTHSRHISVIGLGYVGLPVAVAFGRAGVPVVAFDIDAQRIGALRNGHDHTGEVPDAELAEASLHLTDDPADLARADFHIVTVPTPIDDAHRPDLRPLLAASRTVGCHLKHGDVVVYESTVYPGATEMDCVPVLEAESGLTHGRDFTVGYSPERINPGDREHRFETITKVVSGSDPRTRALVAAVYGSVVKAGVHEAPSIAVAEAAKVIENTQRDVNIALMNELAVIFHRMGIDTRDVLEAAGTKWNFLPFQPGLVGGHCIGVDPYYLTHRAEQLGHNPEVILAGRRINDTMGQYVAQETVKRLLRSRGGQAGPLRVTVLGLTFKEDVPDIRNTRVVDIVSELRGFGVEVAMHDPLAPADEAAREYGLTLTPRVALPPADAVILAVPHAAYRSEGWDLVTGLLKDRRGLVMDVKGMLDRTRKPDGVQLWRL